MADSFFSLLVQGTRLSKDKLLLSKAKRVQPISTNANSKDGSLHLNNLEELSNLAQQELDYFDYPIQSNLIESNLIQSNPIQSNLIQPIPTQPIPTQPIPTQSTPTQSTSTHSTFLNNFQSTHHLTIENYDSTLYSFPTSDPNHLPLVHLHPGSKKAVSTITQFQQFQLSSWLFDNICQIMNWHIPTTIQQLTIPPFINGKDCLVASPTGSGKTAAYLIPLFQLYPPMNQDNTIIKNFRDTQDIETENNSTHHTKDNTLIETFKTIRDNHTNNHPSHSITMLVIAPTRDLCRQIYLQAKRISTGQSYEIGLLSHSWKLNTKTIHYDLVIATPAIIHHLSQTSELNLSTIRILVLDEVDTLLNDQFILHIDSILLGCKSNHLITCMFSATLNHKVEQLAKSTLKDPIYITIGIKNTPVTHINQYLKYVGNEEGKLLAATQMLSQGMQAPILMFMQSKYRAKQLCLALKDCSIKIAYITGEQSEEDRIKILNSFRIGSLAVLITTDVLARGLDFITVATIINYDLPTSITTYIHRIGRTGRTGGVIGTSWTLYTDVDIPFLKPIVNVMINSGQGDHLPEWLKNMKNISKVVRQQLKRTTIDREDIITTPSSHPVIPSRYYKPKQDTVLVKGLIRISKKRRRESKSCKNE